jgi:hypothetical protein
MARPAEDTTKLTETEDRGGDPRRHGCGMPAGAKQELLDSGVTEPQVTGDLSQRAPLDRPEQERSPLANAQFAENRGNESALDDRRLGVGLAA